MTTSFGGIEMFMQKLIQLINNSNDIPLFNNPIVIHEKPKFQLLYEELVSMNQTLFIDQHQHQHLSELDDLKKRFICAAEEAEYTVDLFLSRVHIQRDIKRSSKSLASLFVSCGTQIMTNNEHLRDFKSSLNIVSVMRSFKSIKAEFESVTIDKLKLDSSSLKIINQTAGTSNTRNSKKLMDAIVVGFDGDAKLIKDKLMEDVKKVDIVSIVGMGGLGKTTLADKVFNDRFVVYHFEVRVWVTVSQTYDKRAVLIQILHSIRDQLDLEKATDSGLRELVHKYLMGKRYFIVIDDIWHIQTWDEVKLFFPHGNNCSRILLTSRLTEVAKHANSSGLIHHLEYLNRKNGWELLCKKVFRDINECPDWSFEPGMQIVENCKGLPLSVIVIAGVLAKKAWSKEFWVEIAERTSSYIVGDQNECIQQIALSYNHLPLHLRECFLYLGGFPEDHRFQVQRLILLWVAEGFIQQVGNQSLEDTAESYLMDLIDRNLIIVSRKRKSDGAIRDFTLHDLVRELCMRKANEEVFFLKVERLTFPFKLIIERLLLSSRFSNVIRPYKPVRMFINTYENIPGPSAQNLRSIIVFSSEFKPLSYAKAKYFHTFTPLRVLDLQKCRLNAFPNSMELLVHLRYLVIWIDSVGFPSSVCKLWSLQTLIYIKSQDETELPNNISDMVNLRHLWSYNPSSERVRNQKTPFCLRSIEKPMNLQTISNVRLVDRVGNLQKCFPYIKELACSIDKDEDCDFKSLTCLEKLKLADYRFTTRGNCITFPATMRELTLDGCQLPWSHMSVIQSLPNLQFLKLKYRAFKGACWNTDGQVLRQLEFLRLDTLDIQHWEACTSSFPCLRQLEIYSCGHLEEIPLEIGDIPTLQLIKIMHCRDSVNESVRRIEEEQNDNGNPVLKIDIREDWSRYMNLVGSIKVNRVN